MGRRNGIKQVYIPYYKWECYKAGMWQRVSRETESLMLHKAIQFTSNHNKYGLAMNDVLFKWDNTMINNLTNKAINRKAFLGHCAVFYKLQIPEYIVRMAWKHLTEDQRIKANAQAEKHIKHWELCYMKKLIATSKSGSKDVIKMAYQTALQLD